MIDVLFKNLCLRILFAAVIASQAMGQTAPRPVASVSVTPSVSEAEVGQELKFTAVGLDAEGKPTADKPMLWFAAPFDIAAADTQGAVTFFAPGEARIGALVAGKLGYATVRIKPARVKSLDINAPASPLLVGSVTRLHAVARTSTGDPRADAAIVWSSDKPHLASIDASGVVTGLAPGRAVLVARSDDTEKKIEIEVAKSTIRRLAIEARTRTARTGDVVRFRAEALDENSAIVKDPVVRWSTSGEGAMIDADGAFVAEKPGAYIVTGAIGELAASSSVSVSPRNSERSVELVGRAMIKDTQYAEQWFLGNTAYLSTIGDKLLAYDISDPANPKLTAEVKVDARVTNDISTTSDGKIGVLTREGASNRRNGIVFLDTSDAAHPKILSEYTETVTGGVHSAFVDGRYVYLTDDATGSMRVIDFKDVKNPKEVARWQTENPLAKMIEGPLGPQAGGRYLHDVQVRDGIAYLAYWRDGVVILDVGNGVKGGSPERPQLISNFRFNYHDLYGDGWLSGAHEVFRYKNYLFVGDEVFPAEFNLQDRARIPVRGIVHVLDVSNLANPRKVAEYSVPEGGAHNIWVEDDVLVMGYYSGGGRILDVSGELRGDLYRQGREMARIWTGDPQGFRPNLPFTWGARHYKGMIFFNDVNSGLWIMRLGPAKRKGETTAPGE